MHQRLHRLGPVSKTLYSKHDIGPIGISRLVAYPNLMYHIPLWAKDPIRKRAVRAAGAPWLIPRLRGVTITTSRSVVSAAEVDGEVQLKLDDGTERRVDHVLLGTGYRVDISKYEFLCESVLKDIERLDGYPDRFSRICPRQFQAFISPVQQLRGNLARCSFSLQARTSPLGSWLHIFVATAANR